MSRETIDEMKTQRVFIKSDQDDVSGSFQTKSKQENLRSEIKGCPVCHARCFADMDVCYGCLHVFSEEENSAASVKDSNSIVLDIQTEGEVNPEVRMQKTPPSLKDSAAFSQVLEIVISVRVPNVQ